MNQVEVTVSMVAPCYGESPHQVSSIIRYNFYRTGLHVDFSTNPSVQELLDTAFDRREEIGPGIQADGHFLVD